MPDRYYDNTRISAFRECPRKFYYRHIRDLTPEGTSPPLVFGSAWHAAMEVLWSRFADLKDDELITAAFMAFRDKWVEEGFSEEMSLDEAKRLGARLPSVALEMLYEYLDARREFLDTIELLAVEAPFAVPLDPTDPTLFYVGRLDKVFKKDGSVYIGEHKTTTAYKQDGAFQWSFTESFSPNSQIDGYLFAGHTDYGDKMKAVWVDAALVHRNIHDAFKWIPVERQFAQLDAWLWETHAWIAQIEANATMLEEVDSSSRYMAAYPKNTNSCTNYGGCPYVTLCKSWANPEAHPEIPLGFKEKHWSPFDELALSQLGMEKPND